MGEVEALLMRPSEVCGRQECSLVQDPAGLCGDDANDSTCFAVVKDIESWGASRTRRPTPDPTRRRTRTYIKPPPPLRRAGQHDD